MTGLTELADDEESTDEKDEDDASSPIIVSSDSIHWTITPEANCRFT